MTPSLDLYACSNMLLCSEEVLEGAFNDDGDEEVVFGGNPLQGRLCDYQCRPVLVYGDWLDVDESILSLAAKEGQHMPRADYLQRLQDKPPDARARQDAVSWILKVQAHYNFRPLTVALAVNYLDRFLSRHPMPSGEKAWMFQLVSVACLSLAAKVEETEVPLLLDLQVEGAKYIFEPRTVQRMEIVILSTLEWRLNAVTPFSYVDLFVQRLAVHRCVERAVVTRTNHLILSTLQDIRYLEHAPSAIAAACTFRAMEEQGIEVDREATIAALLPPGAKVAAGACEKLMEERVCSSGRGKRKGGAGGGALLLSVPPSPSGVLDASFGCDSESTTVRSLESSQTSSVNPPSPPDPALKKPRRESDNPLIVSSCMPPEHPPPLQQQPPSSQRPPSISEAEMS